jgi:hypothetical protein
MPKYAIVYKDSKDKTHYTDVYADSAVEAKKKIKDSSVTIEGLGGKYITVRKVVRAERIPNG